MMHDFGLTETYVVLFDLPVTFSLDAVAAGVKLPYTWNSDHPARVGLVRRDGVGPPIWCEIDPCFVFHALNAYDDDAGRVVVDLVKYAGAYDVATMAGDGPLTFERWLIDPSTGTVEQQPLDDRAQEFPRVDPRRVSRAHRYGCAVSIAEVNGAVLTGLRGAEASASTRLFQARPRANGSVEVHDFGAGMTPGEAIFVPRAPDAAEDDGYVLAFVHDPDRDAADLVILAAQDIAGEPVGPRPSTGPCAARLPRQLGAGSLESSAPDDRRRGADGHPRVPPDHRRRAP